MRNTVLSAAAAALLAAMSPAHAQHKCTDAKGKVIYQESPCPGNVRAVKPSPFGPGTDELWAEMNEMEQCIDDWGAAEKMDRQQLQGAMGKFLLVCRKWGFVAPGEADGMRRNGSNARELRRQHDILRQQAYAAPAVAGREARERAHCITLLKQAAETRAELTSVAAEERVGMEADLDRVERRCNTLIRQRGRQ